MPTIIASIVTTLRDTAPFHDLPATNRPQNALWTAYNRTLLALRLPLYHNRLGKARPKPKAYTDAVQMGLALLAAFAHNAGTQRAIIRINRGGGEAISFQPRPWDANWTAQHALQPDQLVDPDQDPLIEPGVRPQISTADILHLSRLVAIAFIKADAQVSHKINATVTIEFCPDNWDRPSARIIFRPFQEPHLPSRIEVLRHA